MQYGREFGRNLLQLLTHGTVTMPNMKAENNARKHLLLEVTWGFVLDL